MYKLKLSKEWLEKVAKLEEGHDISAGSPHRCHARGCFTACKPEMLMCLKHWRMVPKKLQKQVWATYRRGQCDDKRPSGAWMKAADAAIKAVWEKETNNGAD